MLRRFDLFSLTRIRRNFWLLLCIFCLGLFVLSGRDSYPFVDVWEHVIIEDPLDVDVPTSRASQFVSLDDDGKEIAGVAFPPKVMGQAAFLDEIRDSAVSTFENEEVVFVTYASSNHYLESREAIKNLRAITGAMLYYYDLGLSIDQLSDLQKVCNVSVVPFKFGLYPNHTNRLHTYAFKPILIAEMYRHHKAFWVIDASARFYSLGELEKFYDKVRTGEVEPYAAEHPTGHTVGVGTNEQIYTYLPLPDKGGRGSGMRQALTQFVVRSKLAREIVKWNFICALTEYCIAPKETSHICQVKLPVKQPHCHRFDQSSLSIVMCAINLRRNLPCLDINATTGAFSPIVGVARESKYEGPLPTC